MGSSKRKDRTGVNLGQVGIFGRGSRGKRLTTALRKHVDARQVCCAVTVISPGGGKEDCVRAGGRSSGVLMLVLLPLFYV